MNLLKDCMADHSVQETDLTRKITIDGKTESYPVHRISLDKLYYNDKNDRIASFISQYSNENKGISPSTDDMIAYNNVIQKFIKESNPTALEKTKDNIKAFDQREPGVVLIDGRVIDGNRRFTCLRELHDEYPTKFGYFEAVILDRNYKNDAKQIKMLELTIQHGEEAKVDYDPIDKLIGVYKDVMKDKLLTKEEYAASINMELKDFNKVMEQAALMIDFLDFANAPEQFYLARKLNIYSSLVDLTSQLRKCTNDDMKEDLKNVVFSYLLLLKDDVTHSIRTIYKIKPADKEKFFQEQLPMLEDLCEALPERLDEQGISDLRTKEEKNTECIKKSIEKWRKINLVKDEREKQFESVNDAIDAIESINIDIVHRLNEDQRAEFDLLLEKLTNTLQDFKEQI